MSQHIASYGRTRGLFTIMLIAAIVVVVALLYLAECSFRAANNIDAKPLGGNTGFASIPDDFDCELFGFGRWPAPLTGDRLK
jgi:hypothetical protein